MPDIWLDVDTAVAVSVNMMPLVSDADGVTIDEGIAYNESGMDLNWNFVTTAGAMTQTNVTPTTSGDYDWTHVGNGMYKIEITASGGASINNDTEGFGWFTGVCDNVAPWRSPVYGFRAAGLNNMLIDSAYSATRGLAGTALPDAAADAAGGLPISDAGGLDLDAKIGYLNFTGTGATAYVKSDVVQISGDGTAADNLETACDNYSATRGLAGTALPNAAADAAGGLPISDAGGLDLDAQLNTDIEAIKTAVDAILVDTGTDGVKLADGALSAAKCAADIKV